MSSVVKTDAVMSDNWYETQGRRHGFEGGGTACENYFDPPPPFAYLGGHETEHCTRFIVVIMTSKRLPAPNEIT